MGYNQARPRLQVEWEEYERRVRRDRIRKVVRAGIVIAIVVGIAIAGGSQRWW